MRLLGSGVLVLACCILFLGADSPGNILKLSTREDTFFKQDRGTGSSYLRFWTNGIYTQIAREHMFVEERDRGTWTQDSSGWVTMSSSLHYRNVEAGPLAIWTWHTNVASELPRIYAGITSLLRTNNSRDFGSDFVGERLVRVPSSGTDSYSPISVDFEAKRISRSQLSALVQAIEVFTNRTDNHHFHAAPMEYRGITFLLWRDGGMPHYRDVAVIKGKIDRMKINKGKNVVVPFVFTSIDKGTFDDEADRTQDFIFYPEMNRPRKRKTFQLE